MRINNLLTLALIGSVSFFASCKKDSTVGGSSGFKYKLTTANRSTVLARLQSGNITWASGFASANMLKFEAKNSGGTEVEFKNSVSQRVDVFASLAATVGNISLPAGTYSEIEF